MKSSLKTLARIQKFNIDEQRKKLNEQLTQEDKIIKALEFQKVELEQEKIFATENPDVGDFGTYMKRYLAEKEVLENKLAAVRKKIEEIRDVMADMFKEQKTYEIVEANRKASRDKEEEIKMQKSLDEIGTNAYIKHNK